MSRSTVASTANRRWPLTILGASLLLGPAFGCDASPEATSARSQETAAAAVTTVATVQPKRATIRKVTREPGQIEAFEVTELHARVAGYVRTVSVDIGSTIEPGQVLAELDAPELLADVEQKKAALELAVAEQEQARAMFEVAQAAVRSAEAKVTEARAAVGRAEAELARWRAEFERTERLVRERAVTAALLDEARNKRDAAEAAREEALARVATAEAAHAQAQAELAKAHADIDAALAQRDVAAADLKGAEAQAGYMRILAPFAGVITRRAVHTGHLTVPGGATDPLFVAARTDRLRIAVGVPEVDAASVHPGDRAEVRVQALDGRAFEGKIARTSWSLDPATRTMRVEIDLENPDGTLRPGLYAYVTITAEERPDVLTIPASAVVNEEGKAFVVTVEAGKAHRQPVVLGLSDGKDVEVVSGMTADQSIVAANAASLTDGQPVRVAAPQAN